MELTQEVKNEIIKQKIEAYRQRYYALSLDLEMAENLDGVSVPPGSLDSAEELIKVIDYLEKKLE